MLWLWWSTLAVTAQVANDNIASRRVLRVEEIVSSATTGCTVQRPCVDERLTGKCIEYHNDQWFEFTPTTAGRYFVNIGGQQCRDIQGVQLVVLTGQPCQPATYQILSCTSLGTQDDVFVELSLPQAGQPYLLNVDGYLKDFCQFTLQVSQRARGLPAMLPPPQNTFEAIRDPRRIVFLEWQVPDSLEAVSSCRVVRRELHQSRSIEQARLPASRNSYGLPTTYTVSDTVPEAGRYLYQIIADGQPPTLVRQQWVVFDSANPLAGALPQVPHLVLPLSRYPRKASLSVVITNPSSGRVLLARQLIVQPDDERQSWLPAAPWQAAGLQKIAVEITCHPLRGRFFTNHLLLDVPPPAAGR